MEDGERAVGVLVDPDLGLDVMMAVAVGGDLQRPALVAHGVVVADGAVLVDAEDVVERAGEGTKAVPSASAGIAKRALCWGR